MSDEFLNNFKIPDYILVPESMVEKCDESGLVLPECPVLVFVNSKSGGQLGGDLLQTYRTLLSEKQVLYTSIVGLIGFPSISWFLCRILSLKKIIHKMFIMKVRMMYV
jgi:hypothetical protein